MTVDGQVSEGEEVPASQGIVRHEIQTLKHPEIIVTDAFGNTVTYDGGSSLPLTYCLLTADTSYSVTVDGEKVPESLVTVTPNPDYEELSKYTEGLPENAVYWIAVLRDNAEIRITDRNGNSETVDPAVHSLDVTGRKTGDGVPANIAAEVDVLAIGEKWSRFMSADLYGDLYGYYDMASYLLYGTYLYDVASRWATSIDITFTSIHTLLDPPFTEERVDNFRQLTDDCFSADVHFVKHMYLSNGEYLDDTMYATLYFLKNESTWNAWKLMQIKEIVE